MIEAHLLFDVPFDRIDVVVHPQSIVHSMVEFTDGSTLAQASPPDMRLPIALALGWPDRVPGAAAGCDWSDRPPGSSCPSTMTPSRPCAWPGGGEAGGTAPAVFNAANEECVEAFLAGRLPFTGDRRHASPGRGRARLTARGSGTPRPLPMFWMQRPGRVPAQSRARDCSLFREHHRMTFGSA